LVLFGEGWVFEGSAARIIDWRNFATSSLHSDIGEQNRESGIAKNSQNAYPRRKTSVDKSAGE
jgi:hypothetical protein